MEILTNVLNDLAARYISIGSENFYLLVSDDDREIKNRVVKGIPIELVAEDITSIL